MSSVKEVSYREIAEYNYENEEQRTEHVKFMTMHGWNADSRRKKIKEGISLMVATEEDYEWYAEFYRSR